jgi:hypothetical protein
MERTIQVAVALFCIAITFGPSASNAQTASSPISAQAPAPPPTAPPPQAAPVAPTPPLTLRVETLPPVELRSPAAGLSLKDIIPAMGGLLGLLGALAAVWWGKRNNDAAIAAAQKNMQASIDAAQRNADASLSAAQRNTEATLWQKANEIELKEIQAKLDNFYGPYFQMSGMNKLLAHELAERQPDKATYRLLVKLFDKEWLQNLSAGDRTVVREICGNALTIMTFIKENAAMTDVQILPYLSRVSAHYRILHLAHKGDLGTEPTNFLGYVYPWQFDRVLKLDVERLKRRCDLLRSAPNAPPGPMEILVIPQELALPDRPARLRSGEQGSG